MKITISEIARLANVSKSSVSLVLNNKPGVAVKTRKKILAIMKKYHYHPSQIAQSLAGGETKSIGLVIKEIDNPYFSRLTRGVYDTCLALGYSMLLGSSEHRPDKETEIIRTLVNKRVDGLIISPLQNEGVDFSYLADLVNDNYPLVVLGNVRHRSVNIVDIDNTKAAHDAVSYLIAKGHIRIAHFAGPVHTGHGLRRLEGYKQALSNHQIPIDDSLIIPVAPFVANGYQAGMELFSKSKQPPTAVFCYNDLVAIGVLNALQDLNVKVPANVSVMGFDNIEIDEYLRIPLTTVHMPSYEIGKAAANLLIKQIGEESAPPVEQIVLDHKIVERESVAERNGRIPASPIAGT